MNVMKCSWNEMKTTIESVARDFKTNDTAIATDGCEIIFVFDM